MSMRDVDMPVTLKEDLLKLGCVVEDNEIRYVKGRVTAAIKHEVDLLQMRYDWWLDNLEEAVKCRRAKKN